MLSFAWFYHQIDMIEFSIKSLNTLVISGKINDYTTKTPHSKLETDEACEVEKETVNNKSILITKT